MGRSKGQRDEHTRLLLKAGTGDVRAYGQLYTTLRPALLNLVGSIDGVMSVQQREDLVQEVFVRAWEAKARFAGTSSARTYLFGIARNVLREAWRSGKYEAVARQAIRQGFAGARPAGPPQPESALSLRETANALRRAQESLTDNQRLALHLVVVAGISPAEAAGQLGCSRNALYQRLHDAKARLREALARARQA